MSTDTEKPTVDQALRDGCKLHVFLSGGGLRVARLALHGDLKGYGEHPYIEEALRHAAEDYAAGGRPYKEVYGSGGLYDHYLTGASTPGTELDAFVRQGQTFDAWAEGDEIVCELDSYEHVDIPYDLMDQAIGRSHYSVLCVKRDATVEEIKAAYKKYAAAYHPDANYGSKKATETFQRINEAHRVLKDETLRAQHDRDLQNVQLRCVEWVEETRGFTYNLKPCKFPNGEYGVSVDVIKRPDDTRDPHRYKALRTGRGPTFEKASEAALKAERVEVIPQPPPTPRQPEPKLLEA